MIFKKNAHDTGEKSLADMAKLQEVMNRRLVQGVFRLLGVREFPALRKDGFFGSNERDMKDPTTEENTSENWTNLKFPEKNPSKHKVVWHFVSVSHETRRGTNNIITALL